MSDRPESETLVDRWLVDQHSLAVHDLSVRLDLEAGLHDVTLGARHEKFVEDVRRELDVEAGLSAVLGPLEDGSGSESNPKEAFQVGGEILAFTFDSDFDRLELRTHTSAPKPRECGCLATRTAVLNSVHIVTQRILTGLDIDSGSPLVSVRLLGEFGAALQEAGEEFSAPLTADVDKWHHLIGRIVRALNVEDAPPEVRYQARELASSLAVLERILNDFTDADLKDAELQNVKLAGVRWSNNTRWPTGSADWIRRHSDEVAPGRFVIRGDDLLVDTPKEEL